MRFVQPGKKRI